MTATHRAAAIGKTVGALAIAGFVAASCSSNAPEAPGPTAGDSPSATAAAEPMGAPASPEQQDEIIAITKTYLTGLNNGDAKMLQHAMCQSMLDQFGDLSVGARPSPTPQQLNGIADIAVAGDLGFGTVEFSLVNDPSAPSKTLPLAYKDEGGWKVCTEA